MDTVIVASSQFYSHYPKRIPRGTVNAEAVLIRLDSEWDNLTVRIHWLNVESGVEKVVLLERDQPNTIPWEVLVDLSELRMGLDGMDGGTVVKPTVWLTYGYVVDGVDPEAGDDPQPPTPSWEQQMVEQARVAAEAAEEAKDAAVNAEKAASQAGPYADEAQKSAEVAKEAQRAASTSAQEAGDAKDQANTASNAAKVHADAAGSAKVAAERAAETAGNAQSGASQSAKAAANSAQAAERAKQEAQQSASIFPKITPEDAGKVPVAQPDGRYLLEDIAASGGETGQDELIYKATTEKEAQFISTPSLTGKGYRIIRAILGTPVTDIRNGLTIARIYIDGKNKDIYMPAVPSSSASRLSVRFSLSESGVVEYQCSGTRNSGDLGTPNTSNPFSSVSHAYGSFLIDGISAIEIQRVDLIAYMSDSVWPVGTNIIFTGEA